MLSQPEYKINTCNLMQHFSVQINVKCPQFTHYQTERIIRTS